MGYAFMGGRTSYHVNRDNHGGVSASLQISEFCYIESETVKNHAHLGWGQVVIKLRDTATPTRHDELLDTILLRAWNILGLLAAGNPIFVS